MNKLLLSLLLAPLTLNQAQDKEPERLEHWSETYAYADDGCKNGAIFCPSFMKEKPQYDGTTIKLYRVVPLNENSNKPKGVTHAK